MDTSGFSQVGRYGTLSLLKRRTSSGSTSGPASNSASKDTTPSPEQSQVVTSFGIDSANLTFGRAPTCDVRLYYHAVDPVHCRVVNEDGKAFLVVQGKAGALVDGYWVYPHTSSSSQSNSGSNEQQQSIIPLTNNCEFEIHGKRFRFTYPPKEVRKILLATPVAQRNRTLRLSMIQSAQVFSPRPSHDPRENLKTLQSPIKASIFSGGSSSDTSARSRSQSPSKPRAVSPLKFGIAADESDSDDEVDMEDEHNESEGRGREDSGESIVLVHTNHPRVVEEERDLVILEDVPLHLILPSPSVYSAGSPARPGPQQSTGAPGTPTPMQHSGRPAVMQPQPQRAQAQLQPPRTPPRRKSMGGTALHRAVLIRSAQRAVWKAEKEREEEEEKEEEMEVLGAVVGAVDGDEAEKMYDENDEEYDDEDVEMRSASDDEEEYTDEEDEDHDNKSDQKPLWRKSLERIIPWPFGGKKEDGEEEDEEHDGNSNKDDQEEDEEDAPTPLLTMPQQTPARRVLGSFMTPQPQARQPAQQPKRDIFPSSATNNAETSTTSTTGHATGPGRYSLGGGEARRVIVQQPWRVRDLVVPPLVQTSAAPSAPVAPSLRSVDPPTTPGGAQFLPGLGTSATKPPVTEVERRAIQERRRSAAREIRENPFWKDGAPGMSPAKVQPSPAKPNPGLGVGQGSARPSVMASPAKLGSGLMGVGMTPKRPAQASPTKGSSLGYSIAEAEGEEGDSPFSDSNVNGKATPREPAKRVDDDEESLDAHGLLERMRETVESMKRRRSVLPPATPKAAMIEEVNSGFGVDDKPVGGTIKKLDFTRVTPAAGRRAVGTPSASESTPKVVSQTRPSSPSKPAQPSLDEDDTKEPEAFSLLRPGARPSLTAKMIEKPSAAENKVHAVQLPPPDIVIDTADDCQDEEQTEAKARGRGRGRPRMLRAPKDEEEPTQAEDEEVEEATQAKPKSSTKANSSIKPPSTSKPRSRSAKSPAPTVPAARGLALEPSGSGSRTQRSRTPQPHPEVEPEAENEQEPAATRSGAARRTRKGTAELEEPEAPAPKKKGRKAAEPEPGPEPIEEEEEVEKAQPAHAKRGRKSRVVAAVVEEAEEPPVAPAPAKRGRPKKVKEPEPASIPETLEENGDDDDELDSYEAHIPATITTSSKKTTKSQIQPPNQVRGRKKPTTAAAAVKQEPAGGDDDDDEPGPLAATRVGRSGRSNSGAAAPAAATIKTPAPGTTKAKVPATAASKPRGRPKTPASAPAGAGTGTGAAVPPAAGATDSAEKENTPGNASGSANGSDDAQEEVAVVKVRVSRRAGANANANTAGSGKTVKAATTGRVKAKAAVKAEQDEEDEELVPAAGTGRARATRVMRTRTKTG